MDFSSELSAVLDLVNFIVTFVATLHNLADGAGNM